MSEKVRRKWILQGNQKKIADKCRQLADLIRRRGTGANKTGIAVQRNTKKSRIGNRGARAEDGGNAGFVEEKRS